VELSSLDTWLTTKKFFRASSTSCKYFYTLQKKVCVRWPQIKILLQSTGRGRSGFISASGEFSFPPFAALIPPHPRCVVYCSLPAPSVEWRRHSRGGQEGCSSTCPRVLNGQVALGPAGERQGPTLDHTVLLVPWCKPGRTWGDPTNRGDVKRWGIFVKSREDD
jgi:hypothetical protein